MERGGWKHSDETRARISATMQSRRLETSQNTKLRMANPAVRQRIREGMRAASGEAVEVQSCELHGLLPAQPLARGFLLN